jgi:enoyl-CoA hydratase
MRAMEKTGIGIERGGDLAVLRLDKARGNAIDEPMAEALAAAAGELDADDTVRGVLLASAHPKLFCPGLDLVALADYDREAMRRFFVRFEEGMIGLYALRKPVVAAVAGAAVAGGCILALTADHRVIREGSPIGLNEVRVGVPLPWWVLTMLRASVCPAALTDVALLGRNFTGEEAREIGLVHEVLPPEGFFDAALARLEELASRDPAAIGTTKAWLRHGALEEMRSGGPERRGVFLDAWFSDSAQKRIRETVASLTARG